MMKRCSIEAFAACPLADRCGDFRDACFMEGSDCDAFNRSVIMRPRTNADVVRAMGDGDLTDTFYGAVAGTIELLLEILEIPLTVNEVVNEAGCKKSLKTWLQKQAKEDANGFTLSGV